MKKTIIKSILAGVIISSFSCSDVYRDEKIHQNVSSINQNKSLEKKSFKEGDSDFQFKANQNLEKINNYFQSMSISTNKTDKYSGYPDYYGGSYINDDGKLAVFIKGSVNRYQKNIIDIIGNNDVEFISCKNSFKELKGIMKSLTDYKFNNNNQYSKNFRAFYLADAENTIVVELEDMSEIKQKDFKRKVLNSQAIIFKNSTGDLQFQGATINAGDYLNKSNMKMGSMAFRVKRNSDGAIGFISSGHVFPSNEDVYQDLTYVGTTSISMISGSVDASFILLHDYPNNSTTNLIGGVNTLSTSTSLPGASTTVNLRGAVNQSSGKILSTDAFRTASNGQLLTDLTSANYKSDEGDSGGLVYSYVSSTNTRYTVGVHIGQSLSDPTIKYYSKAPNVLSALGVSRY